MVAHQAPGFAEHLPPFSPRDHRDTDAFQVNPAAFATRLIPGILIWFLTRFQHPQAAASLVHQGGCISGKVKIRDALDQGLFFLVFEFVDLQQTLGLRFTWEPGFPNCTFNRVAGIQHAPFLQTQNASIFAFIHRESDNALFDSFQVQLERFFSLFFLGFFLRLISAFFS